MGFADTRRAEQEQRRDFQRISAVFAQSKLAFDVVQHLSEVGQVVVEVVHHRQTRGFDLKTLGAFFQHALVCGAQAFVFLLRQLVQLAADFVHAVHRPHACNRYAAARCRHSDQLV